MIKTRAEIIAKVELARCPHKRGRFATECKVCLIDLLARRDEMVIEECVKLAAGAVSAEGVNIQGAIRALKGKM